MMKCRMLMNAIMLQNPMRWNWFCSLLVRLGMMVRCWRIFKVYKNYFHFLSAFLYLIFFSNSFAVKFIRIFHHEIVIPLIIELIAMKRIEKRDDGRLHVCDEYYMKYDNEDLDFFFLNCESYVMQRWIFCWLFLFFYGIWFFC